MVIPMTLDGWRELREDESYVVIQATKVGMYPMTDEIVIDDEAFYKKVKVGYDLIYNPMETSFMKMVSQSGARAFNGFKMLLYQGIIAYELWTGKQIDEELAAQTYQYVLEQMGK